MFSGSFVLKFPFRTSSGNSEKYTEYGNISFDEGASTRSA